MKRWLMMTAFAAALFMIAGIATAEEAEPAQATSQIQNQTQIYGSQMMTEQERMEYSAKMQNAKTAEEKEKIRLEHHEQMKQRAEEKGVTLSDEPPTQRGGGMGPHGPGMGKGGMGQGKAYNR